MSLNPPAGISALVRLLEKRVDALQTITTQQAKTLAAHDEFNAKQCQILDKLTDRVVAATFPSNSAAPTTPITRSRTIAESTPSKRQMKRWKEKEKEKQRKAAAERNGNAEKDVKDEKNGKDVETTDVGIDETTITTGSQLRTDIYLKFFASAPDCQDYFIGSHSPLQRCTPLVSTVRDKGQVEEFYIGSDDELTADEIPDKTSFSLNPQAAPFTPGSGSSSDQYLRSLDDQTYLGGYDGGGDISYDGDYYDYEGDSYDTPEEEASDWEERCEQEKIHRKLASWLAYGSEYEVGKTLIDDSKVNMITETAMLKLATLKTEQIQSKYNELKMSLHRAKEKKDATMMCAWAKVANWYRTRYSVSESFDPSTAVRCKHCGLTIGDSYHKSGRCGIHDLPIEDEPMKSSYLGELE